MAEHRSHVQIQAGDFHTIHDRDFVIAAYRAVLGREPDDQGLDVYLSHLRSGMTKAQVLAALSRSEEGRRAGTSVGGLQLASAMQGFDKIPIVGRILRGVINLSNRLDLDRERRITEGEIFARLERQHSAFVEMSSRVLQAIDEIANNQKSLAHAIETKASNSDLANLATSVAHLKDAGLETNAELARKADAGNVAEVFDDLQGKIEVLRNGMASQQDFLQLQSVVAVRSEVEKILEQKADRVDVEHSLSQKADGQLLVELGVALDLLRTALSSLQDSNQQMIVTLDQKSDRREVAGLTSSLLKLTHAIVGSPDVGDFERSIRKSLEHK